MSDLLSPGVLGERALLRLAALERLVDHGEEILWGIDEHATLFIEPNSAQAGAGRITLAVAGLDALLEHLAAQRIAHEPIETYSNGVRHVKVPDPDGNAIAFAEPPDAASA